MKKSISFMLVIAMVMSCMSFVGITGFAADGNLQEVYVNPTGAGSMDGSSWENAMTGDKKGGLQAAWDKVSSTGTLYVGGGNYINEQSLYIKEKSSGSSLDAPKKIIGIKQGGIVPTFFGPFTLADQKGNLIRVESGAKYVTIDNLKVNQYQYPIYFNGKNTGFRIYNINAYEMTDGLYIKGGATAESPVGNTDFIIDNCTFTRYCKSAIRFCDGNNGMLVSNVIGDAGGVDFWYKTNFPLGFHARGGEGVWDENITYVNCVGMNAYQEPEDINTYWNGDGFCSEGNTRNITYIRCRAYNNTDGGWDDKAKNPTLIECVTANNKRNWRFWTGATIINSLDIKPNHPDPRMGPGGGIWAGRYSNPKIYNTTFYDAGVGVELGGMELYDTVHVTTNPAAKSYYDTTLLIEGQNFVQQGVIFWNGVEGTDPGLENPGAFDPVKNRFDGKGTNYNSTVFGASKGYYYDADTYANRITDTSKLGSTGFADVTDVFSWAKESIDYMTSKDLMPGITTGAFAPYANMTRIQFASMLVRTLGIKAEATGNFADMERYKKWKDPVYGIQFYDDVAVAKAAGIVKGYTTTLPDGTQTEFFTPGGTITREEMMVMMSRALKIAGKLPSDYNADVAVLNGYSDLGSISEWAKQDVANMVEKAIIQGSDGMINPQGKATRAEGAVIGKRVA